MTEYTWRLLAAGLSMGLGAIGPGIGVGRRGVLPLPDVTAILLDEQVEVTVVAAELEVLPARLWNGFPHRPTRFRLSARAGIRPRHGRCRHGYTPIERSRSGAASAQAPVVVGTVTSVSGTTVLVTNFAGTAVTVTVPATATVTTPGLTPLAAGETVSVSGAKQADGSVVATAIVARAAG